MIRIRLHTPMKIRHYMLIINPKSGTGSGDAALEEKVYACVGEAGGELEVRYSEAPGHCATLAREAVRRRFYAVLAAGGDGTVNEVASQLVGTGVILGIIPKGSGNGLARHLDQTIDIDHALRVITEDYAIKADYGTANGRPFFCTFGLGFDAKVSHDFATMKRRGLSSYIRSALRTYLNYSPKTYEITTGGKTQRIRAFLIAVCNASQYGNNAYIAPDASIRDGLLDITLVHAGNPLTRAITGVDLFTGYIKRNVLVQTMRVERAIIKQIPGPAHIDGDPVTMPAEIHVKCHPGKLNLFTDGHKSAFHPILTPLRGLGQDVNFRIRYFINHVFSK